MDKHIKASDPEMGKKIDAFDKNSMYLIKIVSPKDICVAFNEYALDYYNAAHKVTSILLETKCNDIKKLDTYFSISLLVQT